MSDAEDGEWGVADYGVGEVSEAADGAGVGAAADHENVGVVVIGGFEQGVFDVAEGDADVGFEAYLLLELFEFAGGAVAGDGFEGVPDVEAGGEIAFVGLHGVDDGDVSAGLRGDLGGEAEDALGVVGEAEGAEPFAVLDGARGDGFGVAAGEHRAVGIVENLGGGGAEERTAEDAGVCGHDDEASADFVGGLRDLRGGVAEADDAGGSSEWEVGGEVGVETQACGVELVFGDVVESAKTQLHAGVEVELGDVEEGDLRVEDGGGSLDVGGHGGAGVREVYGKEDAFDERHEECFCDLCWFDEGGGLQVSEKFSVVDDRRA